MDRHMGVGLVVVAVALARLCTACGGGNSCEERRGPVRCSEPSSVVLHAVGYVIVRPTSNCTVVARGTPGDAEVLLIGRSAQTTCHIDVTLDFGEVISMDVPLTKAETVVCCGVPSTTYLSPATPLELRASPPN